jgi:predicted Holliday junction resolvase-like endonuclease
VDLVVGLAVAVTALAVLLVMAILGWRRSVRRLLERLRALDSQKRSQSTRYGQISEQFAPFLADWPWDPKRFRFLGAPVDGVQFTDEGVVFVEIKAADSALSGVQRQVRDHVESGRVFWKEVRLR